MLLDHFTDLGNDGRHISAALLVVAAARIEYRFELLHQEGDIATFSEDRGGDAGQRHDPHEVLHVFRVDEHLERSAMLVRRTVIDHYIVDGDIHRMIGVRCFDLVGIALKNVIALKQWGDVCDIALLLIFWRGDRITGDLLLNFNAHSLPPRTASSDSSRLCMFVLTVERVSIAFLLLATRKLRFPRFSQIKVF